MTVGTSLKCTPDLAAISGMPRYWAVKDAVLIIGQLMPQYLQGWAVRVVRLSGGQAVAVAVTAAGAGATSMIREGSRGWRINMHRLVDRT